MNPDKPDAELMDKETVSSCGSELDSADGEFEPTAEMLVNDFDDEGTLDEEEAIDDGENQEEEVDNLTRERDMPIEQLLAKYGTFTEQAMDVTEDEADVEPEANGETPEHSETNYSERIPEADDPEISHSSTSDENSNIPEKEEKPLAIKSEKRKRDKSDLSQLYPEIDANGDGSGSASVRSLRSCSRPASEDEDEDMEGSEGSEEDERKKQIMIGSIYQAVVPEGLQHYGDTPPYENEDKLLWQPEQIEPPQVDTFLKAIGQPPPGANGICSLPMGSHIRDNEQALHLLLQCGYNIEEALRRFRMNPAKVASSMTLWSEEECRNFENGLRTYGKDFHMIQQNKVRTRSVGELVQFYYLWKKTERHDMFANKTRIEKKKYIVHPGTTDYMDRFLDEGENINSSSSSAQPRVDNRDSSPATIRSVLYGNCLRGVQAPIPPSTITSSSVSVIVAEDVPDIPPISSNLHGMSENIQQQGEFLKPYSMVDGERLSQNMSETHSQKFYNTTNKNSSSNQDRSIKRSLSPGVERSHKLPKKSNPTSLDTSQLNKAEAMAT